VPSADGPTRGLTCACRRRVLIEIGNILAKGVFLLLFSLTVDTLSCRHAADAVPQVRSRGQRGPGRCGVWPQEDL
jgi:hypothetical protein